MIRSLVFVLSSLFCLFSKAQINLSSGLKVCYDFNGNTSDQSGHNNHGVLSGSVTLASDRMNNPGKVYHFSGGLNDFIAVCSLTNITTNNELSISMWAQAEVQTSTCLFMLEPDNASDRCVGCAMYSGVGLVWDYGSIYTNGRITQPVNWDNLWHHYVFSVSEVNNTKSLYMDGVLVAGGQYGGSLNNKSLPVFIGAGTSDVSGGSLRWRGKIDEVRIYNRAVTAAEVGALYSGTFTCNEVQESMSEKNQAPVSFTCTNTGTVTTAVTNQLKSVKTDCFYPSPASDVLYFSGVMADVAFLEIYSSDMRIVGKYSAQDIRRGVLDMSSYAPGLYLLRFNDKGNNLKYQKVIVER